MKNAQEELCKMCNKLTQAREEIEERLLYGHDACIWTAVFHKSSGSCHHYHSVNIVCLFFVGRNEFSFIILVAFHFGHVIWCW